MRLALEAFGLQLAVTFGPVDEPEDEPAEEAPAQLSHVEGSFDTAPAPETDYGDPENRRRVGFAPPRKFTGVN